MDRPVHMQDEQVIRAKRMCIMGTKSTHASLGRFKGILEQKQAELVRALRVRDDITIEKSADQMDEIQYASERDLAIRSVDLESKLLREVRSALQRVHDGGYGTCVECDLAISPKRLAALPWASRCIACQDACDQDLRNISESFDGALESFA